MLLSGATGLVSKIPAGLAGLGTMATNAMGMTNAEPADVVRDVQSTLTYRPHSASGQAGAQTLGQMANFVGGLGGQLANPALQAIGNVSPTAENIVRSSVPAVGEAALDLLPAAAPIKSAIGAARGANALPEIAMAENAARAPVRIGGPEVPVPPGSRPAPLSDIPPRSVDEVLSNTNASQSISAAAATPNLEGVSPELRQAILANAQRTGGAINPTVLARHVEADTLPVRMRLSEGQALQDPVLISEEMNTRAAGNAEHVKRLNEQNTQLAQNVQAIRDEIGPDVFSTNPTEHADTIIATYRARNEAAQAQINSLYKALRDENGGQFPVDAKALLDNASKELHRRLLFDHAPSAVMRTLNRLSEEGNMTFENFESLRTNLARIARSQTVDGNEKAAASVIRSAMEQLPMPPQAGALKPLADAARNAARRQFQALEADPAYKAAVDESISPDRFIDKYVIRAPRDDVMIMRQNLADDPTALQTLGVATVDHLRGSARLDPYYNGNFAAAGYNKALQQLGPKMQALVTPQAAEQLEKLGNVARYTTAQPKGSYVNNSNTLVGSLSNGVANTAEGMLNFAAAGAPLGTALRKGASALRDRGKTKRSLAPGAGLDRLDEPPKGGKP
jgi:hypothetical protein